MLDTSLAEIFVALCDWRGRCTWINSEHLPLKVGEFVWDELDAESAEELKLSIGRIVALRDTCELEVVDRQGNRYKGWAWPLDSPEVAVCVLFKRIPASLSLLTQRERECLELLAQGISTQVIATQLDLSTSTIHSHLKSAREKLALESLDALISFAARFCFPDTIPLNQPTSR